MSPPGKDDGYALIDVVVAILLVSVAATVILSGLGSAARTAAARFDRCVAHIDERNAYAAVLLGTTPDAGED